MLTSFSLSVAMGVTSLIQSVIPSMFLVFGLNLLNGTVMTLQEVAGTWLLMSFAFMIVTLALNFIFSSFLTTNVASFAQKMHAQLQLANPSWRLKTDDK
jgi:uncharacterized membrane protein SirB2